MANERSFSSTRSFFDANYFAQDSSDYQLFGLQVQGSGIIFDDSVEVQPYETNKPHDDTTAIDPDILAMDLQLGGNPSSRGAAPTRQYDRFGRAHGQFGAVSKSIRPAAATRHWVPQDDRAYDTAYYDVQYQTMHTSTSNPSTDFHADLSQQCQADDHGSDIQTPQSIHHFNTNLAIHPTQQISPVAGQNEPPSQMQQDASMQSGYCDPSMDSSLPPHHQPHQQNVSVGCASTQLQSLFSDYPQLSQQLAQDRDAITPRSDSEEPYMNELGCSTKHNWNYDGREKNRHRAEVCRDKNRVYRATWCCKCEAFNLGWYSHPSDEAKEECYKTCISCDHVYGREKNHKCIHECCNPEWSAVQMWARLAPGFEGYVRSVDDWQSNEALPMRLQVYPDY